MRTKLTVILIMAQNLLFIGGCAPKEASSFAILPASDVYAQDGIYEPRKIDVLWVIDNSGSMQTSQENLASNFNSFIARFKSLKFDFHIGIIGTDAWLAKYGDPNVTGHFALLRDGFSAGHSGIYVIDNATPNIESVFTQNALLGIAGTGDERAFESIETALNNPANSGFRREDAFLAIVILSDEDDFSSTNSTWLRNNYSSPDLIPISYYESYLDSFTGRESTAKPANYSVSTITITDNTCATTLNTDGNGRAPGTRYMQIATDTNGTIGSLCGNFGTTLSNISDSIVNYSSVFPLTREPKIETIEIFINDTLVSQSETDGWTYRASDNAIWFHGNAIPPSGSRIRINFDPTEVIK